MLGSMLACVLDCRAPSSGRAASTASSFVDEDHHAYNPHAGLPPVSQLQQHQWRPASPQVHLVAFKSASLQLHRHARARAYLSSHMSTTCHPYLACPAIASGRLLTANAITSSGSASGSHPAKQPATAAASFRWCTGGHRCATAGAVALRRAARRAGRGVHAGACLVAAPEQRPHVRRTRPIPECRRAVCLRLKRSHHHGGKRHPGKGTLLCQQQHATIGGGGQVVVKRMQR